MLKRQTVTITIEFDDKDVESPDGWNWEERVNDPGAPVTPIVLIEFSEPVPSNAQEPKT